MKSSELGLSAMYRILKKSRNIIRLYILSTLVGQVELMELANELVLSIVVQW